MRLVLSLLVATICACGRFGFDAPGDAPGGDAPGDGVTKSVDGFWVVIEAQVRGETLPRTRADRVAGIRSDLQFSGTEFIQRSLLLADGVGAEPPRRYDQQLAMEDDTWFVSNESGTAVFEVTWTGPDDLAAQFVPGDPRTTGLTPYFERVVIQRATPPPSMLVGSWNVSRLRYPGLPEFATTSCSPLGGGGSRFVTAIVDTERSFLITSSFDQEFFSDPDCTDTTSTSLDTGVGYLEATGLDYTVWIDLDSTPPVVLTGLLVPTASGVRFEQSACEGSPGCSQLPLMIELDPR